MNQGSCLVTAMEHELCIRADFSELLMVCESSPAHLHSFPMLARHLSFHFPSTPLPQLQSSLMSLCDSLILLTLNLELDFKSICGPHRHQLPVHTTRSLKHRPGLKIACLGIHTPSTPLPSNTLGEAESICKRNKWGPTCWHGG